MLAGESDRDDAERAASSAGRPPSAYRLDTAQRAHDPDRVFASDWYVHHEALLARG